MDGQPAPSALSRTMIDIQLSTSLQILLGGVGAGGLVLFARRDPRREPVIYALGLAVAALVYLAFAVIWGGPADWGREAAATGLFGLFAAWGRRRPLALAAGWTVHVAWDVFVHRGGAIHIAPGWYPNACIGFDLLLAAYLLWWAGRRSESRA